MCTKKVIDVNRIMNKDLMKKAVLDAASRKKRAAVIKAGVQISRLALGVAGKLALV